MLAAEVGLSECGLPNTPLRSSSKCSRSCDSAYRPAARVVEVRVPAGVKPREVQAPQLLDERRVRVAGMLAQERRFG